KTGSYHVPENVTVHTLGKELGIEKGPRIMRYIALMVSLRKEYTHVFAHMNPEYVIAGGLIWRLLRKKIGFWYVHGSVSKRLRLALSWANVVFTASKESFRIESPKVRVLGHGIDTEEFRPGPEPSLPLKIVSIGRLSPAKRPDVILDAFA